MEVPQAVSLSCDHQPNPAAGLAVTPTRCFQVSTKLSLGICPWHPLRLLRSSSVGLQLWSLPHGDDTKDLAGMQSTSFLQSEQPSHPYAGKASPFSTSRAVEMPGELGVHSAGENPGPRSPELGRKGGSPEWGCSLMCRYCDQFLESSHGEGPLGKMPTSPGP